MAARKRQLAPWEIVARRRNALRSTGPRTPEGKRRSALNSLKWQVCTKRRQRRLVAQGEDPREFRRLHRDLIALFGSADPRLGPLVAMVADEFWRKARALQVVKWISARRINRHRQTAGPV